MLTAPKIDRYLHQTNISFSCNKKSNELIDRIFQTVGRIAPTNNNSSRTLWFKAERGPIEDFDDYEQLKEYGEVETYEEFEALWTEYYPDEVNWYEFTAIQDNEYRAIFLGQKQVIEQSSDVEKSNGSGDITELCEWLLVSLEECIASIKNGTYNKMLQSELPAKHRIGTITRKELWNIFPEQRKEFFKSLTKDEINEFVALVSEQPDSVKKFDGRIHGMTANDFYKYCALGYAANNYKGIEYSPRKQYEIHADGRDDGLSRIDPDSAEAFAEWLEHRELGGHPWEVCRGGNSTHISLFVRRDERGYFLILSGDSVCRTIETVKFYLALRKAGLPIYLTEGAILIDRLLEKEKIGIVPEGVIPQYCHHLFPNENFVSFMNMPHENTEKVIQYCIWQKIREVKI